jgi:hypothetical protein
MPPRFESDAEALLRRQARRLHWGLMLYLGLLLMIGIGVLRLALTTHHFDRLTVTPAEDTSLERRNDPEDTSGGAVMPVSGVVPWRR